MKQFNLEEYLANPNRRIVIRDGRAVKRILCTDVKSKYPIVVVIENHDGNTERAISLTKDGKYLDGGSDNKDIFFATEKHEGWLNIYRSESGFYLRGNPYKSKEEAMRKVIKTKTEELAQSCALILRYKENINPRNLNNDADDFLKNCSYTGLNLDENK